MNATLQVHLTDLASRWRRKSPSRDENDKAYIPTALDLFRIGSILHFLSENPDASQHYSDVRRAYDDLLRSLPLVLCNTLFQELFQSLAIVMQENAAQLKIVQDAVESLAELLDASQLAVSSSISMISPDLVHDLARSLNDSSSEAIYMLLFNVVLSSSSDMEWQVLIPLIHTLQEDNIWVSLMEWTRKHRSQVKWKQDLLMRYDDHMQQDYLRSILLDNADEKLQSVRYVDSTIGVVPVQKDGSRINTKMDPVARLTPDERVQQRIDQLKQILPHFGEGYLESALSYYKGDVEQTLQVLLSSDEAQLPMQLRLLDKSLPRRAGVTTSSKARIEEEEARETTRKVVQATARREEEEAYLIEQVMIRNAHDEYNDDYDDQYDDMDGSGGLGGTDSGLYDNYEAVLAYNRTLREVEQEQSFWQASRNTNREIKATSSNDSGDDAPRRKYRGPDKLRGGRIPRAGRGDDKGGREKSSLNDKEPPASNKPSNNIKRGQGGGRGRGDARGIEQQASDATNGKSRGNQRRKAQVLAKRRDKQKQAGADRAG